MQITAISPSPASAVAVLGDVSEDGATFDSLMAASQIEDLGSVLLDQIAMTQAEEKPGTALPDTLAAVENLPDLAVAVDSATPIIVARIEPRIVSADLALARVVADEPAPADHDPGGTVIRPLTTNIVEPRPIVMVPSPPPSAVRPEGADAVLTNVPEAIPAQIKPDSSVVPSTVPSTPAVAAVSVTDADRPLPAPGSVAVPVVQAVADRPGRKPASNPSVNRLEGVVTPDTRAMRTEGQTAPPLPPPTHPYDRDPTPRTPSSTAADVPVPTAANTTSLASVATDFRPLAVEGPGIARDSITLAGTTPSGQTFSTPPVPTPAVQLSQAIVQIIQKGADTPVEVSLRPEELGTVRFDLMTTGDRLHITLFVERPEAMDLIRRHCEQLLSDLRQSGFTNPSLSFGEWAQRDTRASKPAQATATGEGGTTGYDTPSGPTTRPVGTGRLDLRL